MITKEELQINNKSYTNKDFMTIYPEELDLTKKLTNRWNPETSNESDPGVVILKLAGFLADKLNYNIDKNVLETFMPSCTQESSMRNLCEISGYYPRYYRSAETTISFLYTGDKLNDITDSFVLPAFSTVISDIDGITKYTLIEKCTITKRYQTYTALAMEGELKVLKVGGTELLHLDNLDENNRLYFNDRYVAENGVFILSDGDEDLFWDKVDNLNTQEPGKYIYKFGFDSNKNVPYIEFPKDIATLIGNGIIVRYLKTTGVNGNVSQGVLSKLVTPNELRLQTNKTVQVYPELDENNAERSVLVISNLSATTNGADPETIDEAYNSFKKVVGTFDTLVTCRDYANAIYNMKENGQDVVSNVQVCDRRTDFNYSNNIVSYGKYGKTKISGTTLSDITPFDLCLYPLNPITTSYTSETYINAYRPLGDLEYLKSELENDNYKTVSHNYKTLGTDDVYAFINDYTLTAKIATQYKVNYTERKEILANVNTALYKKFNPRELDYGYEIPFDTILETIQNADTRIKNVSLDEPLISTKVLPADTTKEITSLGTNDGAYYTLVAKNVLNGRIPLFDYQDDFEYLLGQGSTGSSRGVFDSLYSVSTNATIIDGAVCRPTGYVLQQNEVVQIIAPNLTTELTYPAYCYFFWKGEDIEANAEHRITGNDYLIMGYTDSNEQKVYVKYTADKILYNNGVEQNVTENIIKPNFLLKNDYGDARTVQRTAVVWGVECNFYALTTDEQIDKRKFVRTTLTTPSLPCYWITKKANDALFTEADLVDSGSLTKKYEYVLDEGEYFIYSNNALTELAILGSGTKLTLICPVTENIENWTIVEDDEHSLISIKDINDLGLNAFAAYSWQYKNLNTNTDGNARNITIDTLQICTLTENARLQISSLSGDIDSGWLDIPSDATIKYIIDGKDNIEDWEFLPKYDNLVSWKIRSRLDLNAGPNLTQKLLSNHTVTITQADVNSDGTITPRSNPIPLTNCNIRFNNLIQASGGSNIDLLVTYLDGSISPDMKVFAFDYTIPKYQTGEQLQPILPNDNGYYTLSMYGWVTSGTSGVHSLPISIPLLTNKKLVMVYLDRDSNATQSVPPVYTIGVGGSGATIKHYNDITEEPSTNTPLADGINVLEISANTSVIYLTANVQPSKPIPTKDTIIIGPLTYIHDDNGYSGLNKALKVQSPDTLLGKIRALDISRQFYYNSPVDNYSLIDTEDLHDARTLFDYNNVANKITLCRINFKESNIDIVKTSRI